MSSRTEYFEVVDDLESTVLLWRIRHYRAELFADGSYGDVEVGSEVKTWDGETAIQSGEHFVTVHTKRHYRACSRLRNPSGSDFVSRQETA